MKYEVQLRDYQQEMLVRLHHAWEKHQSVMVQMPIREPDLMIVLTGGKMAYTRPDGVKIIPIGCLKD